MTGISLTAKIAVTVSIIVLSIIALTVFFLQYFGIHLVFLGIVPIATIAIVGIISLTKYLTTPLLLLARHIEELPQKTGDDRICRLRSGGEVGFLLDSFNRMVEELDQQKLALSKSEDLYRTLVEFTSEFIFWRSADRTTMVYVSPNCVNFTGYTDVEFYENPGLLDEIVAPSDREQWFHHVTAACDGQATDPLELRLVSRSGSVCWVTHLCHAIFSERGALLGIRGSFSDITNRKKVEQTKVEQLYLLQTLIDAIPAPVFYKDAKGVYLGCNSSFETYLGLTRVEIIGKTVFELFPEELARVYYEADCALLQRPGVQCYEAQVRFNEGTLRDVMFYKATFLNLEGGLGGLVGTLLDITERNTTEALLRSSEEKFRLFFEESRDAIFVTDDHKRLVNVNDSLLELFGHPREELIGQDVCQNFCDESCREAMMQELVHKGYLREVEVNVRKKDGSVVVCLLSASARTSGTGDIVSIQGSLHDITARKEAEEVLIRQNEYLAALHETTKGLIGRLDLNSLLHDIISRAGALMKTGHGYIYLLDETKNRMVRESSTGIFSDFFDYTIKKGYGLVGKVWQSGSPLAVEDYHAWSGRLPDPAREVLRAMVGVPLTSGEKVVGVIGLALIEENRRFGSEEIDILTRFAELASLALDNARLYEEAREELHERQRAEEQLRKLSHAVEQSPVSVVITDTTGAIEYVNRKFTETTGYIAEEVLGKNPRFLKSGENPATLYESLWQTITSGREWSGEMHNKKKSGELFWELASISPIRNAEGAITHYIAVKEDITEQKKLENQLRQSQKMDAVGKLAGGIAHDFNNIMTAIIGYATILDMKLDPDGPYGNSVKQILFSAKRATMLTEGLLAFSRKQVSHPRPTQLNDVVRRVEKILERLIGEDIELTSSLADAAPTVMVDPFQMEQVLINLATNARDAMPAGGKLHIATDRVMLDERFAKSHGLTTRGLHVKLTVSDTGTGMDQSIVKRIFEPFFTTKELGKGTGLGLSIVYGIVDKHNGAISCYSEPGVGTAFTIYFPAIEAAIEEHKPEIVTRPKGGSETILLAEDDGVVREFTRELLADYGYKVITAVDGEDAIVKFSENAAAVDLLILDLVMPRKNGRETYEIIGKVKPGVKVIFSSGYEADAIQKRGTLPDDFHYLAKPVTPALLLAKVREVLDL